ncbi:MAG: hypothetical protein V2G42_08675 [bacterium JZ-2024 1]
MRWPLPETLNDPDEVVRPRHCQAWNPVIERFAEELFQRNPGPARRYPVPRPDGSCSRAIPSRSTNHEVFSFCARSYRDRRNALLSSRK